MKVLLVDNRALVGTATVRERERPMAATGFGPIGCEGTRAAATGCGSCNGCSGCAG